MRKEMPPDPYRKSRIFYCIEATLEYLISILVGETYLAKIAKELGASDALTGVLYSFVSLGCAFQLISVFRCTRNSCCLPLVFLELLEL